MLEEMTAIHYKLKICNIVFSTSSALGSAAVDMQSQDFILILLVSFSLFLSWMTMIMVMMIIMV